MTPTAHSRGATREPSVLSFHVANWFQWCLDARDAGYSQADMRWILNTVGVMDELRRAVEADNAKREQP